MRNKENICNYCTKQWAITTLFLNTVEIKCSKGYLTCYFHWAWLIQFNKLKQKLQLLTLPGYIYIFQYQYFVLLQSQHLFCTWWSLTCFPVFYSKHLITFEKMNQLSCWFHCVDIFYIEFRLCETFKVMNSTSKILLFETLYKHRTIKCWFTLV